MDGLSADKLRVLLHPVKDLKDDEETIDDDVIEDEKSVEMISKEVFELQFKDNKVLATLNDGTRGLWKSAQVMYSYPLPHKVTIFAPKPLLAFYTFLDFDPFFGF